MVPCGGGSSGHGVGRRRGPGRARAALERGAIAGSRPHGGGGAARSGRVLGGGSPAARRPGRSISRGDPRARAQLDAIAAELGGQGQFRPRWSASSTRTRPRPAGPRCAPSRRSAATTSSSPTGPTQLDKWTETGGGLSVFRELHPIRWAWRSFDRFAHPHRAFVARATALADRLEIEADVERVEKFLRGLAPGARAPGPAPRERRPAEIPVCSGDVVIGAAGEVAAAGSTPEVVNSRLVAIRPGRLKPGTYTRGAAGARARRQLGESRGRSGEVSG